MNEHNALNEDKMADMETQAITDIATRWSIDEKLVDEIIQDYAEIIENFERYLNERYPNENMNVQPYMAKEITNKAARFRTNSTNRELKCVHNPAQYLFHVCVT